MKIKIKAWEKYCEYLREIKWKVKPVYWFSATIILALIAFAFIFALNLLLNLKMSIIIPFIISLTIADLMIGYPYLRAVGRIEAIERELPEALKQMADILKTGGTYEYALTELSKAEIGLLKKEFESVLRKLEEGENIRSAMQVLKDNIDSRTVKRAVTIIVDSIEAGAPMSEVLEDIADDVRESYRIKSERRSLTLMQVLFIVAAGAVVAPFIFGLVTVIIEFLVTTTLKSIALSETQIASSLALKEAIGVLFQTYIFFMVIAVSSMASIMREGKLSKTIIYLPLLLLLAFGIYFIAMNITSSSIFNIKT